MSPRHWTFTQSEETPLPFIRRLQSITSAAPTSTFFGSQPRRARVPPNGLESMTATCRPALLQRADTADAADPVPITTTSNFLTIVVRPPARGGVRDIAYLSFSSVHPRRSTAQHALITSCFARPLSL